MWAAPLRFAPCRVRNSGDRLVVNMRFSALIPLLVAALGAAYAPAPAAAEGPEGPCAEGPQREGTLLVGTPCADRLVAGPAVTRVEGGAGDDVIVAPRSAADG